MTIGNLRGLVRGAINSVNPDIAAQYLMNTGPTVAAGGKQTATFAAPVAVQIQAQPTSSGDIQRYDFLSGQGVFRAVWMFGVTQAIVRSMQRGGDLLKFPDFPGAADSTWLVKIADEQWSPDGSWCKVICVQQLDPANPQ